MHVSTPLNSKNGKPEEGNNRSNNITSISRKCLLSAKDHSPRMIIMEDEQVHQGNINGISESRLKMNGTDHRRTPIKSTLKKTLVREKANQITSGNRKVTWPDAHDKDIAHAQEFDPSVSDDGELGSLRNSCVCLIL